MVDTDDFYGAKLNPAAFRLSLFTDSYASKILAYVAVKPSGAQEISRNLDIPIAVCYRRLKELEEAGLIKVVRRFLNRRGKRVNIYAAVVSKAKIEFVDGHWSVKISLKSGATYEWGGGDALRYLGPKDMGNTTVNNGLSVEKSGENEGSEKNPDGEDGGGTDSNRGGTDL